MFEHERERRLWSRIEGERAQYGVPQAICSTLTPFPIWVMIVALLVFVPAALILAFFIRRQVVLVQADEVVVLDLSFWRYRIQGERARLPLGAGRAALDGGKLRIEGETYYPEPGWSGSAERIVALDSGR